MPYTLTQEMRDIAQNTLLEAAGFALMAYLFPGLCARVGLAAAIGASRYLGGTFIFRGLEFIGFDKVSSNFVGLCLSTYLAKSYFHIKMTSMLLMMLPKLMFAVVMNVIFSLALIGLGALLSSFFLQSSANISHLLFKP